MNTTPHVPDSPLPAAYEEVASQIARMMLRYPAMGLSIPERSRYERAETTLPRPASCPSSPNLAEFSPRRHGVCMSNKNAPLAPNIPDPAIMSEAMNILALRRTVLADENGSESIAPRSSVEFRGDRGASYLLIIVLDHVFHHRRNRPLRNGPQQALARILLTNEAMACYTQCLGLMDHVIGATLLDRDTSDFGLLAACFECYIGGLMMYDAKYYGSYRRTLDFMIRLFQPHVLPHLDLYVDWAIGLDEKLPGERIRIIPTPPPTLDPTDTYCFHQMQCNEPFPGDSMLPAYAWHSMVKNADPTDWRMFGINVPPEISFRYSTARQRKDGRWPHLAEDDDRKAIPWSSLPPFSTFAPPAPPTSQNPPAPPPVVAAAPYVRANVTSRSRNSHPDAPADFAHLLLDYGADESGTNSTASGSSSRQYGTAGASQVVPTKRDREDTDMGSNGGKGKGKSVGSEIAGSKHGMAGKEGQEARTPVSVNRSASAVPPPPSELPPPPPDSPPPPAPPVISAATLLDDSDPLSPPLQVDSVRISDPTADSIALDQPASSVPSSVPASSSAGDQEGISAGGQEDGAAHEDVSMAEETTEVVDARDAEQVELMLEVYYEE